MGGREGALAKAGSGLPGPPAAWRARASLACLSILVHQRNLRHAAVVVRGAGGHALDV